MLIFSLIILSCSKDNKDNMPVFQDEDEMTCEEALLWDYPAKPETGDWAAACQIPEKTLLCLSTDDLTDLCLRYPLIEDVLSSDTLDEGLDQLFAGFNGISALYQREEAAICLLRRYQEKIQSLSHFYGDEISRFQTSVFILDALLSRVEGPDEKSLKEILHGLFSGYQAISALDADNTDNERLLQYNFFARAHVIAKISEEYLEDIPYGKNNPVFAPEGADSETENIINRLSYRLCDYCDYEEAELWEYPDISIDELLHILLSYSPKPIDSLQIPENILFCLSTEKLIDLSLQFPFVINYFGFWIYNKDVDPCGHYLNRILLSYNGIRELYARKDATHCLLKRYNEEIQSYLIKGGWVAEISYNPLLSYLPALEIMLVGVVEKQDDEGLKEIMRSLIAGYETMITKGNPYLSSMIPNFWTRANIILKMCGPCLPDGNHNQILYTGITNSRANDEAAEIINKLSYQLIE